MRLPRNPVTGARRAVCHVVGVRYNNRRIPPPTGEGASLSSGVKKFVLAHRVRPLRGQHKPLDNQSIR